MRNITLLEDRGSCYVSMILWTGAAACNLIYKPATVNVKSKEFYKFLKLQSANQTSHNKLHCKHTNSVLPAFPLCSIRLSNVFY